MNRPFLSASASWQRYKFGDDLHSGWDKLQSLTNFLLRRRQNYGSPKKVRSNLLKSIPKQIEDAKAETDIFSLLGYIRSCLDKNSSKEQVFLACLKIVSYLFIIVLTSSACLSIPTQEEHSLKNVTEADVKAALEEQKQNYPTLYHDALRVWGNFKAGANNPNYAYRFWARDLILNLRKKTGVAFETKAQVETVFIILYKLKKISKDACHVLTNDVWGFLIYREGRKEETMPDHQITDKFKGEQEV